MPVIHRFPCTIAAGGNAGNVTSANWNDAHFFLLVSVAYSANAVIPAWSYTEGAENIEWAECTGTINLTLPDATDFPGMQIGFINLGTGTITITDGGSFTAELVNNGQTLEIYASTVTGAWQIRRQSA